MGVFSAYLSPFAFEPAPTGAAVPVYCIITAIIKITGLHFALKRYCAV
jgi:hypothetical protein